MDTKKLRQKILDLAIHGKLVPQDPNDEPASVLLERIRAEKERLIKEGKIKRGKKSASDTPHYENRQVGEANEVPFEVPESWEWTTLGEITNYGNCENVDVNDIPSKGWILELEDLEKDSAKIIQRLTKDERDIKGVRHSFHKGDVLYSKLRTYLNKVLVADEDGFCTTEIIPVTSMASVLPEYLNHVLRSKYFVDYTVQCGYGVKMPRLSTTDACNGQIPLPPYNEQKHIVASIEGWFQIIDLLETAKEDLQTSITQAKSKILDLAIHGKLVPQDPNDEPAIELLKRINPKFTPCDNAHYENVPFEIPKSWRWTCMAEVNEYNSASVDPSKSPDNDFELYSVPAYETGMPEFVKGKDISSSKKSVSKNDVLLCKINPHLNRAWIVSHYKENRPCLASSEWIIFRNSSIIPQYLSFCFTSNYFKELMLSNVSGVGGSLMRAQPAIVNKYLFPLPPINEQCRIVAAIQEYYEILDNISANL